MTKDDCDRLVETSNQQVIVNNQFIKKLESLSESSSFFRDVREWRGRESLKLWSQYVLFCTTEHSKMLLQKRRNIRTTGNYDDVNGELWEKETRSFLFDAIGIPEPVMKRLGVQLIRLVDPILDRLEETTPP